MKLGIIFGIFLGILVPAMTFAGDATIMVERAVAGATHKGAKAGAGYLTLTNHSHRADTLIAVEADFPMIMLHTTEMKDGVAYMMHLDGGVEIAPNATVVMAPGGMHVMFMGLGEAWQEGAEIPAVLVFENAGRVEVSFTVVPISELGAHGDGHGSHDS